MRKLLICGALAIGALLPAGQARAYDGPWCLKAPIGFGVVTERCHFRTFEACRGERAGLGGSAFCVQNSRFLPYWQGGSPDQEPRRKTSRKNKKKHRS